MAFSCWTQIWSNTILLHFFLSFLIYLSFWNWPSNNLLIIGCWQDPKSHNTPRTRWVCHASITFIIRCYAFRINCLVGWWVMYYFVIPMAHWTIIVRILLFISRILRFVSNPKENDSYLSNKSHLKANLRIQMWILWFNTCFIKSHNLSDLASKNIHSQKFDINNLLCIFLSLSFFYWHFHF